MCLDDNHAPFRLAGRVVEIVEEGGRRKVKVLLEPWAVFDLGPDDVGDLHLGDRLGMEAALTHVTRAGSGQPQPHGHAHPHRHPHSHDKRTS